jgi:hypothetical protein
MNKAIVTFKGISGICPAKLKNVQFSMYCTWNCAIGILLGAKKLSKEEWEYTNKYGITFTIRPEKNMDIATREYYNDPRCNFISFMSLKRYKPFKS